MPKIKIGGILYLVGLGGAAIVGLLEGLAVMPVWAWTTLILVLAGIGIGAFNVTSKETQAVIIGALGIGAATGIIAIIPAVGGVLEAILAKVAFLSLAVIIVPAVKLLVEKLK